VKKLLLFLIVLCFSVQTNAYDKKSLVERFTNDACGPCASINNAWYNATTGNMVNSGAISHIIYNVWWPSSSDPMYLLNQADNTTRTNYYGVNGVPHIEVNGNTTSTSLSAFNNAVTNGNNEYAPFDIVITQEAFSENLIRIGVKITRDPNDNTVFGNVKLRVGLTEKTVAYSSPRPNGESEFFSVCRKMLPNAGGTTLTIPAPGDFTELSVEYVPTTAFLQAVNLDSIRVVAFIQEDPSQTVYQSAMLEVVPDFVAVILPTSPDVIGDHITPAQFSTVIRNIGVMSDMYYIESNLEAPAGWTGEYTTDNGTFPFGEIDSIEVAPGDSTVISVTVNPEAITGYGETTVEFASKNNPGLIGSAVLRIATTIGNDILVIDASEDGYGEFVSNSLANVFPGTNGTVSPNALNSSAVLDNFKMITWSAGNIRPVFHPEEVDALQGYLDGGGKLFINGQDIGEDVFGAGGQSQFAQGFYNNYLHASFMGAGTSYLINGIPDDPITDGIQFVFNFDIYPPLPSPDNIAPYDGDASSIFLYLNGPNIAGIKATTSDHQVVYFGFCFEQIPTSETRDTLVSRIINYFDVEPAQLPSVPNLISPANSNVIDSSSTLFVWEQSQSEVSRYWLELDTTDQFSTAFTNSVITDTTFLYSNLQYDKSYWWRVKAYNSAGWSDFSDVRMFTTETPVSVDDEQLTPREFSLDQNYPNPFNPSTIIWLKTKRLA